MTAAITAHSATVRCSVVAQSAPLGYGQRIRRAFPGLPLQPDRWSPVCNVHPMTEGLQKPLPDTKEFLVVSEVIVNKIISFFKVIHKNIRVAFTPYSQPSSISEMKKNLERSHIFGVLGNTLAVLTCVLPLIFLAPVWRLYPWISTFVLLTLTVPYAATVGLSFMFSAISIYAEDRFIVRKIFYTLNALVFIPSILAFYLVAGEAIMRSNYENDIRNPIVRDAIASSGFLNRLPPERLTPISKSDLIKNFGAENVPENIDSQIGKFRGILFNSNEIEFILLITRPGALHGIAMVLTLMIAIWFDTMLAAWRVKKRFYGLNALEAAELSQFIWKSENGDGRGGGYWIRGPTWVRGYNKPLLGVAEPEISNG